MSDIYIMKQDGPVVVVLTDDPVKIKELRKEERSYAARFDITVHGKDYFLLVSGVDNIEELKRDSKAAVEFARKFLTEDGEELLDMARVLLCKPRGG